jgi:hypothetical protein
MCFSETWFDDRVTDDSVYIDGFGVPYRSDRDPTVSGKHHGGGVCLYVNEQYCNRANVTVRKQLSTPDLDMLCVSLRPKYLPREFGQVFVTVVYSHPKADTARAATEIADAVRALQVISPDAPNFVLGDFNSCDLRTTFPSFKQYITCNTRKNNRPDRCYGNIRNAYKSLQLPNIGLSDHDTIHLLPAYRPKIQTDPVVTKTVKVWSTESVEQLQGCFDCTDWNVFLDSSDDVNEAADVVSEYIVFCENMIVPAKEIKLYPNNKPWISKSLKNTIKEKRAAFQSGDEAEKKRIQKKLREEIRQAKLEYKKKVESQFESGNMRNAWQGLKSLTGQNKPQSGSCPLTEEERTDFSNNLNDFYCRFERDDLEDELSSVMRDLQGRVGEGGVSYDLEIHDTCVESLFKKLNPRKAVGPDRVCGKLLRSCATQLCFVFSQLFSWSLRDSVVPRIWKDSIICPVPKSKSPSVLNDYRPVALTSIVMKCFERIVLRNLLSQTKQFFDPHQFAYKHNRSTDDATLTLLNNTYTHLEKPGSYVRILFIDFSSAFNTIQPHLMALKLLALDVCPRLILWILSFLVNRSQSVRFHRALSSSRSTSTGSPQGTVLSPVLFTLYTNDCRGSDLTPLIKYSDDTALQDLSNSNSVYFNEVLKFSDWCKENYLNLNVDKTKELIIDFRKKPTVIDDLVLDGKKVERVSEYKYLGTVMDNKLNFDTNTKTIHKKCQSRIFCLQKLRSLNVNQSVLGNFYKCFIESVLTFGFLCWFGGLSVRNKNVLNRVVNVCGKVVGESQMSLCMLYERRAARKAKAIISDGSHVLAQHYELLPSGRRFKVPRLFTIRAKKSFIPMTVQILNERYM